MSDMSQDSTAHAQHVVIVGGGFGGLQLAQSLRKAPVRVTLIDRRNFHLFQPLLYQVATGGLSPANIATPLRGILRRQKNASVVLEEVTGFDVANNRVLLKNGHIKYDTLVVAAGAKHSYFGHDEWEALAPGLKTIEDATEIRRRVLMAFEAAEVEEDSAKRTAWMTFVIVGGGPSGVELAGSLAELARHTLKHDFRNINPADARIIIVDAVDRVLHVYPDDLSKATADSLTSLGVTMLTSAKVTDIQRHSVTIENAAGVETIATRTVLWAAGMQASPLARALAEQIGGTTDRAGRLSVQSDLSLSGFPDIYVIGDMASFAHQDGKPLPGVAPVAMQQGKYVARRISRQTCGMSTEPFRYHDPGMMATIGRSAAVAVMGRRHFKGFIAWLLWLFVHLMQLVQFQNRLLVFVQWAWSFLTWNRSARLITGQGQALNNPVSIDDDLSGDELSRDVD
jgi:NADH:ubiquinone reductase (H+-translocating)